MAAHHSCLSLKGNRGLLMREYDKPMADVVNQCLRFAHCTVSREGLGIDNRRQSVICGILLCSVYCLAYKINIPYMK